MGAGGATQPELAGPERRASAQAVRVVSVKDNKTMLFCKTCFRPEQRDCVLGDRQDVRGDRTGGVESRVKASLPGCSSSFEHLMLPFLNPV